MSLGHLKDISKGAHIHFMGICGTAMASLAGLLKDRGFRITGSDANPYPPMSTQLEKLGIEIKNGYRAENLHPKPDFVIVGNVISRTNVEAVELEKLGLPYTSLPSAIGEFIIGDLESVVVSGTHGKTTTTALMSWIFECAKLDPGFLIGGIPQNFSVSFRKSKGKYFIIEGDEYDTAFFDKVPKFIHYRPKHVILTSIEFDHADIYRDLDHVKESFIMLLKLIPEDGTLVYHGADKNIQDILHHTRCRNIISYGKSSADKTNVAAQYEILNQDAEGLSFRVTLNSQNLGTFNTKMTGEHNLLNLTAGISMSHRLGLPQETVSSAIRSFSGVKRRQEILGEPGGVLVIEDFAHHPTAVRETVNGIKVKYPQRKMFAVFEPRSATSRRKVFQKDYVQAFRTADEVILAEAFDQLKIDEANRFSSQELASDINTEAGGRPKALSLQNADHIVEQLKSKAQKGDLILIMSNGGFDNIYGKLLKALTL
ncbi:MAG: UDP-N-acetylmuramate:L-alanyl-gamma-D-glutamyl-meso-diaminopimelate ligase [Pseudobdellovibrionaceae bacterium]